MARVMKYCTPRMLEQLRLVKNGAPVPDDVYWQLLSRGWIDVPGKITPAGIAYLIKRGYT